MKLLLARIARLEAEAAAVLAARTAGTSLWGSDIPPLVLQKVLELLQWEPAVCGVMRLVCSKWGSFVDALLTRLRPRRRSLAVMAGKMGLLPRVTKVDLSGCEDGVCGDLAELGSMPSLRSLVLPASCAERAVDAEALCGLTTLTKLRFLDFQNPIRPGMGGLWGMEETDEWMVGEWVLDLSRLTTLNSLDLAGCYSVTDQEVEALSNLPGLMDLNLSGCGAYEGVTSEGLRAVSSLAALTTLNLNDCPDAVTDEILRAMSSLTALSTLNLARCDNVTAEAKQALRTAIPNLTIRG
jgi:hypothetical protein